MAQRLLYAGLAVRPPRQSQSPPDCKDLHHGAERSVISVTAVRANQLPRAVSRADAVPASLHSVSMPSRPRSATVLPKIGLSQAPPDGTAHAPRRLRRLPPPFKHAISAARFVGDRRSVGARGSSGARNSRGAAEFGGKQGPPD